MRKPDHAVAVHLGHPDLPGLHVARKYSAVVRHGLGVILNVVAQVAVGIRPLADAATPGTHQGTHTATQRVAKLEVHPA